MLFHSFLGWDTRVYPWQMLFHSFLGCSENNYTILLEGGDWTDVAFDLTIEYLRCFTTKKHVVIVSICSPEWNVGSSLYIGGKWIIPIVYRNGIIMSTLCKCSFTYRQAHHYFLGYMGNNYAFSIEKKIYIMWYDKPGIYVLEHRTHMFWNISAVSNHFKLYFFSFLSTLFSQCS